jgi:hypothetical protein
MISSEELLNRYGRCLLPEGTLLFRGHISKEIQQCMFFMLKFSLASHGYNDVQVWRVSRDIELLFMVDSIAREARVISSIEKVYSDVYPESIHHEFDDLDIKHRSIERRNAFVNRLQNLGLTGWFSSYENNAELEICLFSPSEGDLSLLDCVSKEREDYRRCSLRDINIKPSNQFYSKTNSSFNKSYGLILTPEQRFLKHKQRVNDMIMELNSDSENERKLREDFFDLRLKLEI